MSDQTFKAPAYGAPTPSYAQNYLYAPTHNPQNSISTSTLHDDSSTLYDGDTITRTLSRTPSPTPSEFNALNGIKKKKSTKEKIQYYSVLAVILAAVIVISVEHENIIKGLSPVTDWLARTKAGFLIPIVILIVMSFPPLFGHEIVAMLAGVTWSLPAAFAIVAVGTLLGEIANYFTFKYFCTARGEKMEKKQLSYALLAHVVRQGGFWVVLVIRFSAIPPHFATAVFSTVGISFWVFTAAAILSLPKSFAPVYVGYAMRPDNTNSSSTLVEHIVLAITLVITIGALLWIRRLQEAAKPDVIYARRKARQGKLLQNQFKPEQEAAV
ncbi:snare associated Golgi protein-domain-containing protein [Mycena capillaripes]|nr:snare associated Golgi protein-domain-containing protein [Mycena capillaripes]